MEKRMRLARLAFALALTMFVAAAAAQPYPARGIRLIVDTSPGGLTDLLARLTGEALAARVGQPVVVENKPGAAGNLAVKPLLERSVPFDPLTDLAAVINLADAAHIFVVPANMEARDLAQFIAYARTNPGRVYYGSAGIGSPP